MKFSHLRPIATILFCLILVGCGGGGGSEPSPVPTPIPPTTTPPAPNSAPTAVNDTAAVVINTPTSISVTGNDSDADGTITSLNIIQNPTSGSVAVNGVNVVYTPSNNFLGSDSFTYQVTDNAGATSATADVSITVGPITATTLSVQTLNVHQSGYVSQNNPEIGATVLTSSRINFSMPANAVSFSISLTGVNVNASGDNLFIASIAQPDGQNLAPLVRDITFCDPGFCAGLVPRATPISLPTGDWSISLGTLAADLNDIRFNDLELNVSIRTGPLPDGTATTPARLQVRPHLTANSISSTELDLVLNQLTLMAAVNGIEIVFDPTVIVNDPQFSEVSRNFSDPGTTALMQSGAADRINLFFLENFSGAGGAGLLGISGGLPGTFGKQSAFNGVLVNATATRSQPDTTYARDTAEIALHEMGHFLGLYHTTERQFNLNDVIPDTPECPASNDRTGTGTAGVADIAECPDGQNLMFWNTDFSGNKTPLSAQQREVIYRSPIAIPGD
jgi:hypothetical protein